MDAADIKSKLTKLKIKYLTRYVQILFSHNKEDLTDEEKQELGIMLNEANLLKEQLKKTR